MGTGEAMEGCSVCADDTGSEDNPLVYCDGQGCNVCVHKACYGIRSIPQDDWFCSKCVYLRQNPAASGEPGGISAADSARVVNCHLCPSKEGAFKPTSDGKWAHVVCALYIREATFKDLEAMEPIVTSTIPKERFQLTCFICLEEGAEADGQTGACTGCERSGCRKAFHVTCAQRKGLLCEINRKSNKLQVLYSGFCGDHIPSVETGILDGSRFRKVPPYPRPTLPSNGQTERASSSSGYSTPNHPEKSPVPQHTLTEQATPPSGGTLGTLGTLSGTVGGGTAGTVGESQQRSSSIKSNASVGSSSFTTESSGADSGIHSASVHLAEGAGGGSGGGSSGQEEQRPIRKPPKKAFAARMDGAGIPSSVPTTTVGVPTMTTVVPTTMVVPTMTTGVPTTMAQGGMGSQGAGMGMGTMGSGMGTMGSGGDVGARYYVSNPFATPHEMPSQFDLTRPSSGQQPTAPPVGSLGGKSTQQENARMSPYPQGKTTSHPLDHRPTPPPQHAPPLLRKRPLSPSILDNETLTISSLIERTIERATTSTTTGVRPPPLDDSAPPPLEGGRKSENFEKKSENFEKKNENLNLNLKNESLSLNLKNENLNFGLEKKNGNVKNESTTKKTKKMTKEKESKGDLRRTGNTATIKDLLACSNLSPQQAGPAGGGMSSPLQGAPPGGGMNSPLQGGAPGGGMNSPMQGGPSGGGMSSPMQGGGVSKGKMQTSSVSGLSNSYQGGMQGEGERMSHSDSPFSRERGAGGGGDSPKTVMMRQLDDRHRYAVEKVQHYLNNNIGPSEATVGAQSNVVLTSATAGPVKGSKRKGQDERNRNTASKTAQNSRSPAPLPTAQTSDALLDTRDAQGRNYRLPGTNGTNITNGPNGPNGTNGTNGTNGYVNGSSASVNNGTGSSPYDDVDTPAGAQAFDAFMMALSTFGMSTAHQSAMNSHPTAATTLDGFFRMQKELNTLKQKVGELEGLKAFYLTQVQSLRSLANKHQVDGLMAPPTMPEEVARLLGVLNGDSAPTDDSVHRNHHHPPPHHASHTPQQKMPGGENASDGLSARLHEPNRTELNRGELNRGESSRDNSQQRSSRPESRLPASTPSGGGGGGNVFNAPQGVREQHSHSSPSSTPKPSSRSARGGGQSGRDLEREREYVNGGSGGGGGGYSSRRGGQYPHLDPHMEGVASGVISTPAAVVSAPQMINMPGSMAGAPFLLQNPQLYSMIDPRMFGMMPGPQGAFFPQAYAQGMGGFMQSTNPADYAGLGRMHTPTSMSGRYQMEEGGGSSGNSSQQHASMKREYEMSRDN